MTNAEDENETKHLEALEGAEARLRLFQIDLLDYDSIAAAVSGCSGVFHVASPCIVDPVEDPEVRYYLTSTRNASSILCFEVIVYRKLHSDYMCRGIYWIQLSKEPSMS